MGWWLASAKDQGRRDWLKRFAPAWWTVNFPRPMMAAATTLGDDGLRVDAVFYRQDDLAGLIWEAEDVHDHPLLRYETSRDFRACVLSFRWRSGGLMPLDAIDGPTLTIQGRDASGAARQWFVRLWNYADGSPTDAQVVLDFASIEGGFLLPDESDPVWAGDVDRMFISLVPPGYTRAEMPLATPAEGWVELTSMACDGAGSVLNVGDALVPPHALRLAGGYDDSYHMTPERLLHNAVALGYREVINHYVGMSHYFRLGWDGAGFVAGAAGGVLNQPCARWHADFAGRAKAAGYELILSLSYELFDAHCPEGWKQRHFDGTPALTGWQPPSALLSPANAAAMDYLRAVALAFVGIAVAAGQPVRFQIGEPWYWVGPDHRPALYDAASVAAYGVPAPEIADVREPLSAAQIALLDAAGAVLGASTLALRDAVLAAAADAETLLLFYAPQVLGAAPELGRVNMPLAWAKPAFNVLQLEDYDFVIAGDHSASRRAAAAVTQRLGYPISDQHYFAGFVLNGEDRHLWSGVADAAHQAMARGVPDVFVWALPQVIRDGFVHFEEVEAVEAFHDVLFPLDLGFAASGGPRFSTEVVTTASGHEHRNSQWSDARMDYDAGIGVRSESDLKQLAAFFRARRGRAAGFRFRDPIDHGSRDDGAAVTPFDQPIGTGDGVATRFALTKRYGGGGEWQERRITRPDPASVRVASGGVERLTGWVLAPGGFVDFEDPPASGKAVTAGFLFDVPVRFAEDRLDLALANFRAGEVPSVALVEIREAP
jgi:uncharacterized protein (TIGR02217 family)